MQRQFQVKPNVVTCGALTDSLVKAGRVSETIQILQYMKSEGIVPGRSSQAFLSTSTI
jgi:pentatricopeptide repeat protein